MKTPEEFLADNGFVTAAELDRQALTASLLSEMEKGLKGEKSSLLMIPAYVGVDGRIPQGSKAIVLDAGGTNFRGGVVTIPPKVEEKQNQPMPGTHGRVGEAEFYDAFAKEIKRLDGKATVEKVGWCFSYPAESTPDLDAKLLRWTKNVDAPEIVAKLYPSVFRRSIARTVSSCPATLWQSRMRLPIVDLEHLSFQKPIPSGQTLLKITRPAVVSIVRRSVTPCGRPLVPKSGLR